MAIIAKASSGGEFGELFTPAPQGVHRAICVDVIDLGMKPTKWGKDKHFVRLVWQLEMSMPDGRPYMADRRYGLSLDDRSSLRHDLETWAGKPLSLEQAAGFDLERLIGVTCTLMIVHKPGNDVGKVFANVTAVLPKQAGAQLFIRDYVRVINRTPLTNPIAPQKPIGPSFAPPPNGYPQRTVLAPAGTTWPSVLPEPKPALAGDPFEGDAHEAHTVTADDIPF